MSTATPPAGGSGSAPNPDTVDLMFSELTAELQRQSDSLGDLRSRAATIFGLAGSVTAFFGLQTFTTVTSAGLSEVIAAAAYVLAALATAYILMPVGADWKLDRVGTELVDAIRNGGESRPKVDLEIEINNARLTTCLRARGELRKRTAALSAMCLLLTISAAGWGVALIVGAS